MNINLKLLSFILVFIVVLITPLSCGGNGKTTSVTVTPEAGGMAEFESLTLDIPPGTLSEETDIKISVIKDPPKLVEGLNEEEEERLATLCQFVGDIYDVDLNKELSEPVTLILSYSPDDIPEGFSEENLYVAYYDEDEGWQIVGSAVDPVTHTVSTKLSHFCPTGLIIAAALIAIPLILGLGIGLLSNPVMTGQSHKYLTPGEASIANAVTSGKFVVDTANNQLLIKGLDLKIKERKAGEQKYPNQMMQDPEGMCDDYSCLFGSLLIASGYPLRVVAGSATYTTGKNTLTGPHQWVEVLVDGQMYYVDTFYANEKVSLIPITEAKTSLQLAPSQMWGKTKDGTVIKPRKYDSLWLFLGEWKLTRTGITPELPVPGLVLNRVIDEKPSWELTRGDDSKLALDYGGKVRWFNTLGQNVKPGVAIIEEDESNTWFTIDGGGSLYMGKLPSILNFILSMGSKENKKIEQITAEYEDEVKFSVTKDNKIQVAVSVDSWGKYLATRERMNEETKQLEEYTVWKEFRHNDSRIFYEAVRKD